MEKLHVIVTAEHIARARVLCGLSGNKQAECCPVALATGFGVGYTLMGEGKWRIPPEARQFILDFDAGKPVEPFEFDADLA